MIYEASAKHRILAGNLLHKMGIVGNEELKWRLASYLENYEPDQETKQEMINAILAFERGCQVQALNLYLYGWEQ